MMETVVKPDIDISDLNMKALIVFALFLIGVLLLYMAFFK